MCMLVYQQSSSVSIYICTHVHTPSCIHTNPCILICIYIHTYNPACMHTLHTYTCIYVHAYTRVQCNQCQACMSIRAPLFARARTHTSSEEEVCEECFWLSCDDKAPRPFFPFILSDTTAWSWHASTFESRLISRIRLICSTFASNLVILSYTHVTSTYKYTSAESNLKNTILPCVVLCLGRIASTFCIQRALIWYIAPLWAKLSLASVLSLEVLNLASLAWALKRTKELTSKQLV